MMTRVCTSIANGTVRWTARRVRLRASPAAQDGGLQLEESGLNQPPLMPVKR
jgi:hypothetical protein